MATKYSVVKGFAAVGEDNVKKYFSPANAHEVGDLPASEIKKHVKAGNLAEYEEPRSAKEAPLEAPSAETDESTSKKGKGVK